VVWQGDSVALDRSRDLWSTYLGV